MNSTETLMHRILANSCGTLEQEELDANGGFQIFYIETHCVVWKVEAKSLGGGIYEIRSTTPL